MVHLYIRYGIQINILCPLGASDHISLNITLVFYTESSINHPSFNYFKGDFASLKSMINKINQTNHVQACDSINDKWDCFLKSIEDGVNLSVAVERKSAAKDKKQWMTKELKNLVKKKTKVWNTYLGAKSSSKWTICKKILNSVTNVAKLARINFEYKLVDDMRDNLKAFGNMSDQLKRRRKMWQI